MDKILVTGGSGLIGLTLKDTLPDAIYIKSSDFDLRSEDEVKKMFAFYKPDAVIHLAGRVAGIYDHLRYPVQYFEDNLLMNTFVLKHSYLNGLKKFIGMISTCSYPDVVVKYPMVEEDLHLGPPTPTVFSYAYTKRAFAVQIETYNKQYNTNYNYLLPCNLYGEHDKFDPNHSHFLSDLMRKISEADEEIVLFGTGKPIRQFMHAEDLIKVLIFYLNNEVFENVNVATQEVLTIREMAEIAIKACNKNHLRITFDPTKIDGQYRKDVSIEKLLRIMPDFKCMSLYDGIKRTYKFMTDRNNSIRGITTNYNAPRNRSD
jgi:GDP-L-fucose synthase